MATSCNKFTKKVMDSYAIHRSEIEVTELSNKIFIVSYLEYDEIIKAHCKWCAIAEVIQDKL